MDTNDLLTNEEMSALLPDSGKSEAASEREKRRRIVPYNFRRPDRLSKEQVRSLYLLHDLFAHNLSSSLPLFLRAASQVTLISVEQQSYDEYLRGLSDPTVIFSVSMHPLDGLAAIEVSPAIAFPVIDRMLGGTGHGLDEQRAATEIEQKVLEGFLGLVTDSLHEVWKPIIDLEMQTAECETRPQLLQIIAPNEIVVTIALQLQIGDAHGTINLCLPVIMLEPIIEKFNQSSYARHEQTPLKQAQALISTLSNVRFPVSAELNKAQAAVDDLIAISKGDVLRTNHRVDQPIYVSVGDSIKFTGNLASCDGRIVVQIKDVIQPETLDS